MKRKSPPIDPADVLIVDADGDCYGVVASARWQYVMSAFGRTYYHAWYLVADDKTGDGYGNRRTGSGWCHDDQTCWPYSNHCYIQEE